MFGKNKKFTAEEILKKQEELKVLNEKIQKITQEINELLSKEGLRLDVSHTIRVIPL